ENPLPLLLIRYLDSDLSDSERRSIGERAVRTAPPEFAEAVARFSDERNASAQRELSGTVETAVNHCWETVPDAPLRLSETPVRIVVSPDLSVQGTPSAALNDCISNQLREQLSGVPLTREMAFDL
ncbi:MAG: hypothetical protein KC561_03740, partial [Myxococcales bacterium]|nr:hypothetical protein [Myxococcales bacterium]